VYGQENTEKECIVSIRWTGEGLPLVALAKTRELQLLSISEPDQQQSSARPGSATAKPLEWYM